MPHTIFETIPSRKPKGWKQWMSRAIVSDDGTLFVPALISGQSDMAVLLCAGWDGTPVMEHEGHLYAPAEWLKKEFPATAETVDLIKKKIAEID